MVKYTLKILQHSLQDLLSVYDQFGILCIKGSIGKPHMLYPMSHRIELATADAK